MNSLAAKINNSGNQVNIGFLLPVAAGFGQVMKIAGSFEDQIQELQAVLSGGDPAFFDQAGQSMAAYEGVIRDIGRTSIFTTDQLSASAVFIARTGVKESETMRLVMQTSNDLAIATAEDIDSVADALTNIGKVTGTIDASGQIKNAQAFTDQAEIIAQVTSRANVDFAEFWQGFKRGGPVATAVGRSFEEIAGAIGFLGDRGIKGSIASTAIQNLSTRLVNFTPAVIKSLDQYGLAVDDVSLETNTLGESFRAFQEKGVSLADTFKVLGLRAAPGFASLLQSGATIDEFVASIDALDPAEFRGFMGNMAETMQDSFFSKLKLLRSELQETALVLGRDFGGLDAVSSPVEKITELVRRFNEMIAANPEATKSFIKAILGLAAIGPINFMFVRAAMSIIMFMESIKRFTLRLPIYAGLAFLIKLFSDIITGSSEASQAFRSTFAELISASSQFGGALKELASALFDAFSGTGKLQDKLANLMTGGLSRVVGFLNNATDKISGFATAIRLATGTYRDFDERVGQLTNFAEALNKVSELNTEISLITGTISAFTSGGSISEIGQSLSDAFQGTPLAGFGESVISISNTLQTLTDFVNSFIDKINSISERIGGFDGIKTALGGLAGFFLELINSFVGGLTDGFADLGMQGESVFKMFSGGAGIGNFGETLIVAFEALGRLLPGIIGFIGLIAPAVATVMAAILDLIGSFNGLVSSIQGNEVALKIVMGAFRILGEIVATPFRFLARIMDTISALFRGEWKEAAINFFRAIWEGIQLVPIAKFLGKFTSVLKRIPIIGKVFKEVFDVIIGFFQKIGAKWLGIGQGLERSTKFIMTLFVVLFEGLKIGFDVVISAIGSAIGFMVELVGGLLQGLGGIASAVWGGIGSAARAAADAAVAAFNWLVDMFSAIFSAIWTVIETIFINPFTWAIEKIIELAKSIGNLFVAAKDLIVEAWGGIATWFTETVIDPIKGAWEDLKSIVTAPLDFAGGVLGGVGGAIGSVGGAIGSVGGAIGLNASGGIFDRATLGIYGEAGREAILPLTRPARMANLMRSAGVAGILAGSGMMGAAGFEESGNGNTYNIYGVDADQVMMRIQAAEEASRRRNGRVI